jgi:hypothetical protein
MSGSIGFQPISLYQEYAANETKYADASIKSNAQATALINYFQANAGTITTPDQLLKNYKILTVVLTAFNLQGSINDTALLKKLLTQDPTKSGSLAQQLGSAKYQLFAQALSNWTTPPFATASDRAQIVAAFTTNSFEQTADTQAPGLANALYFTREASSIKTLTALQSDTNLLAVAVATTGVPYDDFGALSFDQQTSLLQKNIKISQLQTPSYVKHVAEQYLVQQQSSSTGTPAPGSLASLYSDGSDTSGDSVLGILDPGANLDSGGTSGSGGSSGGDLISLFA